MLNLPSLTELLLLLPAILIGLTFHEFAHGWVADRLGDHTARYQGRLTLNPLAHIDPVGFLMLILFKFGWAKPVPVNPYNMRGDPSRNMLLVSLAGPAANILVALLAAVLIGTGLPRIIPYGNYLFYLTLQINVVLAIFNLIPVPPLDGSKILAGLLPGQSRFIYQMETYGTIILLILLFTGVLGRIIWPAVSFVVNLFLVVARII
ncbi:site-2 protease family protein [Desulfoscipio geothermicus]|uniref:Zn-dependent protease (Includes SpoIVFB) n=1 Tax=Desulfoscipio geothermicus DSM 3669 TaxID=1121426 RepID=A0A1I6CTM1_9FIRM|nr:site-2 protease family protein [Desulfoscipio geothermicus]SFQ96519.1 Zn-dependent protease (includes SpoIVFB) [Desulfoscipio geothermicus DSM 3669]